MSEVKEMPQIDNSVAGEINTPVAGEIKVENTNQPIASEQTATEAMLSPLSPEVGQDLNLAEAGQPAVAESVPNSSETAQASPNIKPETAPKPSEPELKKFQGPEALRNATNLTELIQAYQENVKENSNLINLLVLQNLMAEKLNKLGSPEEALKFISLAAQTENNLYLQQNAEHLAHLLRGFSASTTNFVEGFAAENNKLLRIKNNY